MGRDGRSICYDEVIIQKKTSQPHNVASKMSHSLTAHEMISDDLISMSMCNDVFENYIEFGIDMAGINFMKNIKASIYSVVVIGGMGFLKLDQDDSSMTPARISINTVSISDLTDEEKHLMMKESQIQDKILKRLKKAKCGVFFKFHNGPYGAKGVSDIVGTCGGISVFMEVKTPTGRLTKLQDKFLRTVQEEGAVAGVVRSEEDAMTLVTQAKMLGAALGKK